VREQPKRRPGRPRKDTTKQRIDITLPIEVVRYIDSETNNRSAFIEQCIQEHQQKWEELKRLYPQMENQENE